MVQVNLIMSMFSERSAGARHSRTDFQNQILARIPATARAIANALGDVNGGVQAHISFGDKDWYKLTFEEGSVYQINLVGMPGLRESRFAGSNAHAV
jgi:hypothetical protein